MELETTFVRLEEIIAKLEMQQVPVGESLVAFENGVKLARDAQRYLREAEQKLQILLESEGEPESEAFDDKAGE